MYTSVYLHIIFKVNGFCELKGEIYRDCTRDKTWDVIITKGSYRNCRKSTGNKLGYWYAKRCVFVLLLYYGCVLDCRDTPMLLVTI